MKIKNIELKNYRLYKGINTVSFPDGNEKNLFLISGENGFGKTTFLHSLLWCLYGRLMADIDETFRKEISNAGGYSKLLISNLNENCRLQLYANTSQNEIIKIKKKGYSVETEKIQDLSVYSVSLEFTEVLIPSIPCQSLKITRSYDIIKEKEDVEILIDGAKNELSVEIGNEIFINDFILNKDIARFFFFDSEKIVTLAETNTIEEKRKLGSAYNEVLGVKKYEDLKKNLENLRLRIRRKSNDIESRNKLNALIEKQKTLTKRAKTVEQENEQITSQLLLLDKEDEDLQIQLLREGNSNTLIELNRQESLLENTKQKDIAFKQQLKQFFEFAPFAISGKLLQQTKAQVARDFEVTQSQNDVRNQNSLLSNISFEMQKAFNDVLLSPKDRTHLVQSFHEIISKYQNHPTDETSLMDITKEEFDEFNAVYSNITTTYRIEFEHLADDYRKNKQVMERTMRNITNMHSKESDSVIKKIRKQKNECEQKIAELQKSIIKLHEERGAINKELVVVSRHISELSKKVSLDDSDTKKDKIAGQLISELNTFLVALKNEKKISLETRIKTTMNKLMHKADFIANVEVCVANDIIDINLFAADSNEINKDTLSKGEQQLYATSLLKALVEESGIEFPVFIDSPLQKFDKSHAKKIITEFYPTVSKQVILFPLLHKELTETELEIMKPFVKATYKLTNENSQSYIQQVDINDLMKE